MPAKRKRKPKKESVALALVEGSNKTSADDEPPITVEGVVEDDEDAGDDDDGDGDAGDGHDGAGSVAARLVGLIDPSALLRDQRGDCFARLEVDDHFELLRLRGRAFKSYIADLMYSIEGRVPGREAIASAIGVLEAKARRNKRLHLWNRVARSDDGSLWLDLTDDQWRAVQIDRSGWRVVDHPPPLFRRHAHQAAHPRPVRGGDLKQFLRFLNLVTEDDAVLFLCSLVVALIPDVPQPVLILHGGQGSAKSTAAKLRRTLIDPSASPTLVIQPRLEEYVLALDHHFHPLFDNLTDLPAWLSNLLCQAATGAGFSKRELYSDEDDVLFSFIRPIVMTGINVPATAPDLLDRSLLIRLHRLSPNARREESALWREFNALRPQLVGGLLDALVGALRAYDTVRPERLPRLADFARWAGAAAEALGYGANRFFAAMDANVVRQNEEVIDGDCLVPALVRFSLVNRSWSGTPTELFEALNAVRGDRPSEPGWPKRAADLGRRLNVLAPVLSDLGVQAQSDSEGGGIEKRRIWRIEWTR